ncbi:MAG: FIST C-terminal domain-containing protein [Candidatus Omnitrophica bacterium]|nr:FIST C-terminal domain-containing protein [Candidatus Omnitrophota bacterium]
MRFASAISESTHLRNAVDQACRQILDQLIGNPCHWACVFISPLYQQADWAEANQVIHDHLRPAVLMGCSGHGVIGTDRVVEAVPAVSIFAAHLPDVRLYPFLISPEELELASPGGFWVDKVGIPAQERPNFVLLADPATCDPSKILNELNETFPGCPIIGGLASGGEEPGEHVLFYDTEAHRAGAVGVAMTGPLRCETLIASGCRPVGQPFVVTKAEEHVVWELGGRQALEVLRELFVGLSPTDQALAQHAVFVGMVINEMKPRFSPQDFLIRHLVGIDPPSGAIAVEESIHVGQTLQFHLRDPSASRGELRRLLRDHVAASQAAPHGVLLFNCVGRGKTFYGSTPHDLRTIREVMGSRVPISGFFCNGEIGPVGGINFLHGYTASLGLFGPR